MALRRYQTLAGAALHYDRFSPDQYGSEGAPFQPFIETRFAARLEACFAALADLFAPRFGPLEIIVSGGVGREGSGPSLHHLHRAFDLDGLFFAEAQLTATDFPDDPHFYLAVEAALRRHFGLVLAYDYNAAHQDHLHIDDSRGPGLRRDARSHAIFVQNLLCYVFDAPVIRDGVWGPETEAAHRRIRAELDLGPFSAKQNWLRFCEISAERALLRVPEQAPRRLGV